MNKRNIQINRQTSETDISISLGIDGSGKREINTPVGFLNHMLDLFTKHGVEVTEKLINIVTGPDRMDTTEEGLKLLSFYITRGYIEGGYLGKVYEMCESNEYSFNNITSFLYSATTCKNNYIAQYLFQKNHDYTFMRNGTSHLDIQMANYFGINRPHYYGEIYGTFAAFQKFLSDANQTP